jgi:hypothetical protein
VQVRRTLDAVGLANLQSCGSVHSCPRCNARVMARRRLEIGAGLASHMAAGGSVLFSTFTLQHYAGQPLAPMLSAINPAWNSATTRNKAGRADFAEYGIVGSIRVLETNFGDNGWHPHLHGALLGRPGLTQADADSLTDSMYARWSADLRRRGYASARVAQRVEVVESVAAAVSRYLTKASPADVLDVGEGPSGSGWSLDAAEGGAGAPQAPRAPEGADRDRSERDAGSALGLELTHSQGKTARGFTDTLPHWCLLDRVLAYGDADARDLWNEHERATKGRNVITWSHGLRAALGVGVEVSDDVIAAEALGTDDDAVVEIIPEAWDALANARRGHLIPGIVLAARVSDAHLTDYLDAHSIAYERVSLSVPAA